MTKSIIPQKISAVFLAAVLIAGTFALISPSFMGGAQAEPYGYGMDSYKKKSYGYDDYKKKSYGHDNYKPKYPSHDDKFDKDKKDVIVKKIKCNQFNLNINGLSVDIGSSDPGSTPGVAASNVEDQELAASAFGNNEGNKNFKKFDKDVVVICISNNDNRGAGGGGGDGGDGEPTNCEDCFTTIPDGGPWPPGLLTDFIDDLATGDFELNGVTVETIADVCVQLATGDVSIAEFAAFLNEILPGQANQVTIGRVIACLIETGDLEIDVNGVTTPIAGTP